MPRNEGTDEWIGLYSLEDGSPTKTIKGTKQQIEDGILRDAAVQFPRSNHTVEYEDVDFDDNF